MNQSFVRALSRVLIVCLAAVSFQARAGLIGTGDAGAPRVSRAAVESKLLALGVTPSSARERIAALTDAEVAQLDARIDELPAGAFGGVAIGMLLVVIFLIWRFNFSDQAKAEKAPKK